MIINLRDARLARGITQQRLSEISGLSTATLSNIERGTDTEVSLSTARKLLAGISDLPPEVYSMERFIKSVHGIFPKAQIIELLASDLDATG